MTSTFFQRILILVLLAGSIAGLHAQEYKYEIGGMAGGAFYMGDYITDETGKLVEIHFDKVYHR